MSRKHRKELIQRLQDRRESKVVAYVTGDRGPAVAAIGDDAVRPLFDHLRELGHVPRLDVFLYSRGGAIDVPWRLANAFRQASDEWNLLVPFRANSAATLLALGADQIVMGPQGELGPIDPSMQISRDGVLQDSINVEDVMAYVKFMKDRAGLSDQAALATGLGKLAERMDAVSLGSAYRMHSHIRDVARRMLHSRKTPATEQVMASIVETLAERVYAHGHAIGVEEAVALGLPVTPADDETEGLMWDLLNEYEKVMKLREPLDVAEVISDKDRYSEATTIAVIESVWGAHSFGGELEVVAKRQLPPQLNVSLNLNLQLPPQIDVAQLPPALQQLLATVQQSLFEQAQQALQAALQQQAPLIGAEARVKGGAWKLDT